MPESFPNLAAASFDFDLPDDAVAQMPSEPRDSARLLVDRGPDAPPQDLTIADLGEVLRAGDLLVVNDTRVLPARLAITRPTGGAGEVLLLAREADGWWEALVRPSAKIAPGTAVDVRPGELGIEVGEDRGEGRRRVRLLDLEGADGAEMEAADELAMLDRYGAPPLPPYLTEGIDDPERYQTVYARRPLSAAAPTAGLHLTDRLLDELSDRGVALARVELAVGLDTFRPLRGDTLDDQVMHTEWYSVPDDTAEAIHNASRVVAVGTTVVRTLEAWARTGEASGQTDLFLRPGADFAVVDALLTNFHFPRSTLLVLLEAFIGPRWRSLYATALERNYRFLSLGDAMLTARR